MQDVRLFVTHYRLLEIETTHMSSYCDMGTSVSVKFMLAVGDLRGTNTARDYVKRDNFQLRRQRLEHEKAII